MRPRPAPFRAAFNVLLFSVLGGAVCGWAGFCFSPTQWGFEAALIGALVGLCISPLEIALLHNRRLEQAAPLILIPSMLMAVTATVVSGGNFGLSVISVPLFIGLTIYARFKYPSLVPKPGHCPQCGYNLTGLKPPPGSPRDANPTCPECGFNAD